VKSIKCTSCGLVSWATAETCKRCGAIIESQNYGEHPAELRPAMADNSLPKDDETKSVSRPAKRLVMFSVVLIVLALPATWLTLRTSGADRAQTFVLRDGTRKTSKAWFHSWFSSDPSGDEIFSHYLKVSGWQDHAATVTSYVANGRFQLKNENGQSMVRTTDDPYRRFIPLHWDSCDGEVELKGQGPDKLLITQNYDQGRVWQRATNGTTGWWRKGSPDRDSQAGTNFRLVDTLAGDLYGDKLADFKRGADFVNYLQLQTKYSGLYLYGKAMVGDRVCYELHSKSVSSLAEIMYFDVETGLLLKLEPFRHDTPYVPSLDGYVVSYTDPSYPTETFLDRYREVNGVKIPFLIRQHVQEFWITTTITEFKTNMAIESSEFEKPLP